MNQNLRFVFTCNIPADILNELSGVLGRIHADSSRLESCANQWLLLDSCAYFRLPTAPEQSVNERLNPDDDGPNGIRDRFFRERRMLLGTSLVLFAHIVSGIDIAHRGEAFGLIFEVSRPSYIWGAAWVLWVWTLICYAQHFNSLRLWNQYPATREEEVRIALARKLIAKRARKNAHSFVTHEISRQHKAKHQVEESRRILSGANTHLQDEIVVIVSVTWGEDVEAIATTSEKFDAYMENLGWRVNGAELGRRDAKQAYFRKTVSIPTRSIINADKVRYPAIAWTLVSTSYGTEYVAPFAIAIMPLIAELWLRMSSLALFS